MRFLTLCFVALMALAPSPRLAAEEPPAMTVWKSPWCGCCGAWVDHMREAGFRVEVREVEELDGIKRMAGVPAPLQSCHTAEVDGYVIEGHVPAADVKRLLRDRPTGRGLAVPGMPAGSPGMETGARDPYDVLLLGRDGQVEVYGSYR